MPKHTSFSKLLSRYCEKSELSPRDLAVFLEYPQSTVYHWCKGDRMPRRQVLEDVCHKLSVDPADLELGGKLVEQFVLDTKLSVPNVCACYRACIRSNNAPRVFELVNIAGAVVVNHLLRSNIQCIANLTQMAMVVITLPAVPADQFVAFVRGDSEGLVLEWIDKAAGTNSRHLLSDAALSTMSEHISKHYV